MPKISKTLPLILAIDTSCDDTSVTVVAGRTVRSNIVASQHQLHKQYGGVFPTVAKQAHQQNIAPATKKALQQAQCSWSDIAAIAVTIGPGLAPALEIGITYAKTLAKEHNKPLIAVNHIEAHVLSPLALRQSRKTISTQATEEQLKFPVLSLVISGGHSEFVLVKNIGEYEKLGQTIDDAAGECLDKVGRLLNLGYPAGPIIEQFAKKGNVGIFSLPIAMTNQTSFDLSFSGLKTAARTLITQLQEKNQLTAQNIHHLAHTIQEAVFGQITYKLWRILLSPDLENRSYPSRSDLKKIQNQETTPMNTPIQAIWLGGGVAANNRLRACLRQTLRKYHTLTGQKLQLHTPYSKRLCSDNAAMIGVVASYKFTRGEFAQAETLDRKPGLILD